MRYPSFIEKGNTIGFVAPSFGCAGEPYYSAFQNSLKKWNALGFKTELGFNCYASDGVGISSSPKKCAAEFMEYYKKETNQALISCGGGELMCEILEYIDFGQLKRLPPKWFMGYSDNTNLIFLLATLTDTAAIYGPNAGAFGMEPWHASIQDAYELLQGKKFEMQNYPMWEKESLKDEQHPLAAYHVTEPFVLHTNKKEGESFKIEGRLLGGCLDCLSHLRGTKFDKVKEFNQKYEAYNKKALRGTDIITLMKMAIENNNNMEATQKGQQYFINVILKLKKEYKRTEITINKAGGAPNEKEFDGKSIKGTVSLGDWSNNGALTMEKYVADLFGESITKKTENKNTITYEYSPLANLKKAVFKCTKVTYNNNGRICELVFEEK